VSSKLQLDVCHYNQRWCRLVNASKGKRQVWCCLQVSKTVINSWVVESEVLAIRRYLNIWLYLYLFTFELTVSFAPRVMDGRPHLFHTLPLRSRFLCRYQITGWWRSDKGLINNLPKVVTKHWESNPPPLDHESNFVPLRHTITPRIIYCLPNIALANIAAPWLYSVYNGDSIFIDSSYYNGL